MAGSPSPTPNPDPPPTVPGLFISFEGPDGAGKTTQAGLLTGRLQARGLDVVAIHEPGGTDLGTSVRALLVRRGWTPVDPRAEALLFSACRAQLVTEVIHPALERGAVVIADRFADSTLAYQGAGRGLATAELKSLIEIATQGLRPHLTLLLDVPPEAGLARLETEGKTPPEEVGSQLGFFEELGIREEWTRFEDEPLAFHRRVRDAYLRLAADEPDRWVIVDAMRPTEGVAAVVLAEVERRVGVLG